MCVRPVREFVLLRPPLNFKYEVRGGGSCVLGVDSRVWEGQSNPYPKKYCCQKYFRQKYFRRKYFHQKYSLIHTDKNIFVNNIFSKNITVKNISQKNIFSNIFLNKILLPKIFSPKIFPKKYFCQIFFKKKRWGRSPFAARRAQAYIERQRDLSLV